MKKRMKVGWTSKKDLKVPGFPALDRNQIPVLRYEGESPEQRAKREKQFKTAAKKLIAELLYKGEFNLGRPCLLEFVRQEMARPPHRPRGTTNPEIEIEMTDEYSRVLVASSNSKTAFRVAAGRLYAKDKKRFGASPEAIQKRLRTLVKKRDDTYRDCEARFVISPEVKAVLRKIAQRRIQKAPT